MASSGSGQDFRIFKSEDLEIKRYLGGGGFGSVSLAIDRQLGYEVAVKELKDVRVNKEVIMKEARKMWKVITCPNLVHIMGITENPIDKSIGIVMEFLEYGDLVHFNRKFMMHDDCMARKIKMIHEIALGMNFLHNQNPHVIHSDLKLENVFVGQGLMVKIGDLGLALSAQTMQNMEKMSKVGAAGTFSHIPPEGWSSSKAIPDKFWDIFTFAITVFELVSGKNPWPVHGDSVLVSVWVREGERPDVEKIPATVPIAIVELVKKCWAQKPSDRPQFQDILRTIISISLPKRELIKADAAIMGRVGEAGDDSNDTTVDSGVDSAWGSLEVMKISGQNEAGTSKESDWGK
ncbi:ankyrin repeat and protein kinase domain-containing protein 1-like [Amphiura filiformis]|uniref:ankyrin repeat and protein kinase domain-containing protein 1-like n=1 Tax=Amphiura filiformis TaxID=82378 RepID=UPI003B21009B